MAGKGRQINFPVVDATIPSGDLLHGQHRHPIRLRRIWTVRTQRQSLRCARSAPPQTRRKIKVDINSSWSPAGSFSGQYILAICQRIKPMLVPNNAVGWRW